MRARPIDAYYTPGEIAQNVAEHVEVAGLKRPRTIADFAAGGGALLQAVHQRLPQVACYASDSDAAAVRALRYTFPEWRTGSCDFLKTRSRAACFVTTPGATYDVVLLNPPFSYRGQRGCKIRLDGRSLTVSPAAAFIYYATLYVEGGELLAILPTGTLCAQKDEGIWSALNKRWTILQLEDYGERAFPGLAARTTLVALRPHPATNRAKTSIVSAVSDLPITDRRVRVVRGCTPVHTVVDVDTGATRRFIHTTGLTRDGAHLTQVRANGGRSAVGPVVLLPRVGNPTAWKIIATHLAEPTLLSDCVIALVCDDIETARRIAARLRDDWNETQLAWTGSCARYLTLRRLGELLSRNGVTEC